MTANPPDTGNAHTVAPTKGDTMSWRLNLVAASLSAACVFAASLCSSAALAMMSERDLDDLGLLPTEVRSEFPSVAIGA
ncbi:MAG: hypothetical protein NTV73_13820 [Hyphomicrobiales bacterium]|nr:hypothetical protein [Hyphomicrobiales bacterium]